MLQRYFQVNFPTFLKRIMQQYAVQNQKKKINIIVKYMPNIVCFILLGHQTKWHQGS